LTIHPAIQRTTSKFEAYELHAARAGREVMQALASVVADSSASTLDSLAADLESNADALLQVMPMYAPPINAMHQVFSRLEQAQKSHRSPEVFRGEIAQAANSYRDWSERARATIAGYGSNVIPNGGVVYTFTLSETVLGTLREARKRGVRFRVMVTESRPNRDGRMTASSLAEEGIDVDISIDGCAGEMVPQADVMLVGAEAVLSDGSAICKVGTYPSALAAREYGVPVYVLVDSMKLHPTSLFGQQLWLDPLRRAEVLDEKPVQGAVVCGHLFDRTPGDLISAVITERGLMHPSQVSQWMLEMPISDSIVTRLGQQTPRGPEGA